MAKHEFKVGEKVLLQLDVVGRSQAPQELKRWDGCQFVISKKKCISGKAGCVYYELKTCRSSEGIPFSIMEEWLMPMR